MGISLSSFIGVYWRGFAVTSKISNREWTRMDANHGDFFKFFHWRLLAWIRGNSKISNREWTTNGRES